MTQIIQDIFAHRSALIAGSLLVASISLSACSSPTPAAPTILAGTADLALYEDSQIIPECDVSKILETNGNNIVCVTLPSTTGTENSEEIAIKTSRHYADAMINNGWAAPTQWPLVYRFEKAVSDECSTVVQLLAWVVDEAKAQEDRNFPTSRITFVETQSPVCGDKRKAK